MKIKLFDEFYYIAQYGINDCFSGGHPVDVHIENYLSNQKFLGTDKEFDWMEDVLRLYEAFRSIGWEGDVAWAKVYYIPPFITGRLDGHSDTVFEIRQGNNGISFLAISEQLYLSKRLSNVEGLEFA